MVSESQDGRGSITLEFRIGQNMERALLLVANRLDRVNGYPNEASEPTMRTSSSNDNAIAWFVLIRTDGSREEMHKYGDFAEDVIQDRLERVPGISRINVYGGSSQQMEVIVDPKRMARYGLTVTEVIRTLKAANASVSAGDLNEGKRRYVVRTEGEFAQINDVSEVLLRSNFEGDNGRIARVTVVSLRFSLPIKTTARIRFNGQPAMAMNAVVRMANVIQVMRYPSCGLQLKYQYSARQQIGTPSSL